MARQSVILAPVLALIAFLTEEGTAYAHIRWFVDKGDHPGQHFARDLIDVVIVLGAILMVAFAIAVDRASWSRKILRMFQGVYRYLPVGADWRLVATLSGILLIINSIDGVYLVSGLVLPGDRIVLFGTVVQATVGLLLISQISYTIAGVLILAVAVPVAAIYLPPTLVIDYLFEFVALGFALMFLGASSCHLDAVSCRWLKIDTARFEHLPLPIIRMGLGMSLVVLSIHNKLLNPDLALTFLDKHDLNFMPYLGFAGFTNIHFAWAAGVGELTLGLLIFAGVATRFATLMLSVSFLGSFFALGPNELVGHLPLFGIAFLLIIRGSGDYRLTHPGTRPIRRIVQVARREGGN